MQIYLHFGMEFSVCSSLGGLQGGDDETAEGGVVTSGRGGAVVLAVGGITAFPIGLLFGIFEDS